MFPYRGIYVRHIGRDQAVADANHVLLFNAGEAYQISHPVDGGDASLALVLPELLLSELVPASLLNGQSPLGFRRQHQRIDPRGQALVALLRHTLDNRTIEPLEAESLSLILVCRSLGPRTSHEPHGSHGHHRLADRAKVLLASDLSRRWTLAEIAAEVGGSPVYLTQVFRQVEGMPLYRYHLRLRLARALDQITQYDDLSALAADLGFSSHSHFTATPSVRHMADLPPTSSKSQGLNLGQLTKDFDSRHPARMVSYECPMVSTLRRYGHGGKNLRCLRLQTRRERDQGQNRCAYRRGLL